MARRRSTVAPRAAPAHKYAQACSCACDAAKGNNPLEVAISLRRGRHAHRARSLVPTTCLLPTGAIITRFNVSGQAGRWGGYLAPVRDGRFVLPGLEPGRVYSLLVHDTKQLLGATIEVSPKWRRRATNR